MRSKRVKCRSGIEGYRERLRDAYDSFEEWQDYSDTYGLAGRLGYKTAKGAWRSNPIIEGSVIPEDFRRVRVR